MRQIKAHVILPRHRHRMHTNVQLVLNRIPFGVSNGKVDALARIVLLPEFDDIANTRNRNSLQAIESADHLVDRLVRQGVVDEIDVEIHRRSTDVVGQRGHDNAALDRDVRLEPALLDCLQYDVLRELLLDIELAVSGGHEVGYRLNKILHQNISFRMAPITDSRYGKNSR